MLSFSSDGDSLTLRRESVTSNGERRGSTVRYVFDGKYHALEYPTGAKHKTHGVIYSRIDERTLEYTIDYDNREMQTRTRHTVSADGRTITERSSGVDEKGQPIRLQIVSTKA
jgi:antitoxin component YwqK of YwqJK toxin-antitoxin module